MRSFYLAGALTVVAAIDCTGVAPYRGGLYPTQFTKIHHTGKLYQNQWYASPGSVPGANPEDETWELLGECDSGTANELYVDCANVSPWSAEDYSEGHYVTYENFVWRNFWYAAADDIPDQAEHWIRGGLCGDMAHVTVPAYTVPPQTVPPQTVPPQTVPPQTVPPQTVPPQSTTVQVVPTTLYAIPTTPSPVVTQGQTKPPTSGSGSWPSPFFAPFVDVTLTVQPDYTQVYQTSGQRHFMLSFINAATDCTPYWAGNPNSPISTGPYVTFNNDIATIRSFGGDVGVSFGGEIGSELADNAACQSGDAVANIKKAYLSVIDQYDLKWIDLDIENFALQAMHKTTGWKYRFEAIKQIQAERPDLHVSWTLPVIPEGLVEPGLSFMKELLASGVNFQTLNVMAMCYGPYYSSGKNMSDLEVASLDSVAQQVYNAQIALGTNPYGWTSYEDVYPHLGSTPMIGVANVESEIYTLTNARESLATWQAGDRKLGMWATWSLTRDHPCSGAGVSPICTSANVQTSDYEFSKIMSAYTQ